MLIFVHTMKKLSYKSYKYEKFVYLKSETMTKFILHLDVTGRARSAGPKIHSNWVPSKHYLKMLLLLLQKLHVQEVLTAISLLQNRWSNILHNKHCKSLTLSKTEVTNLATLLPDKSLCSLLMLNHLTKSIHKCCLIIGNESKIRTFL